MLIFPPPAESKISTEASRYPRDNGLFRFIVSLIALALCFVAAKIVIIQASDEPTAREAIVYGGEEDEA